jgi:hypothetical protein
MRLPWIIMVLAGLLPGWAAVGGDIGGAGGAGGWRLVAPAGPPTPVWLELTGAGANADLSRRDRRGGGPDAAWVFVTPLRGDVDGPTVWVWTAAWLAGPLPCNTARCTRGPPRG